MLCGKAVIEIKPPGFNKGTAVCELLQSPPFAQRIPLFVGDDVTDESVFAVLPALGGFGYSVGREVAGVEGIFDGPQDVRDWLAGLCGRGRDEAGMNDFGLDLAVIGNGRTAALVDPSSRIVWWCYPRFDGDPIFSRLLAGDEEKGFCDVVLEGMVEFSSEYVRNTAIVSTVLTNDEGASIRITDFAPRFREYDRIFRPPQLMRIIEPIAGLPRVTIRVRPTSQLRRPDGAQIDRQQSCELPRSRRG